MTIMLALAFVVVGSLATLLVVFLIVGRERSRRLGRIALTRWAEARAGFRQRGGGRRHAYGPLPATIAPGLGDHDARGEFVEPSRSSRPVRLALSPVDQLTTGVSATVEAAVLTTDEDDVHQFPGPPSVVPSAVSPPRSEAEVGVRLFGSSQRILVPKDGEPVIIGSSTEAGIQIPGEPAQAAIVFSDGVAMVTRLSEGPMSLGSVEVGPVGVPITPLASRLVLETAIIDVSAFAPATPSLPLLMYWSTERYPVGAAQLDGCAAIIFGASGQAIADHTVSCFSGVGRRSAVWALEAGNGGFRSRAIGCAVGVADVGGEYFVLVAAQSSALEAVLEPGDRSLRVVQEREGLQTVEFPLERQHRWTTDGEFASTITARLFNNAGKVVLQGVLPLQPAREEIARQRRGE